VAPPEPRRPVPAPAPIPRPTPVPAPTPERDFGDDPLGTGYIAPTAEASTPLADQSWESIQRGRRSDDLGAGEPRDAHGRERFETRFRRPPEE
jgi:hypothetical protein